MKKDYKAFLAAKNDIINETGGFLTKEDDDNLDEIKSTKRSNFYEEGDGDMETSWKKMMRKLGLVNKINRYDKIK